MIKKTKPVAMILSSLMIITVVLGVIVPPVHVLAAPRSVTFTGNEWTWSVAGGIVGTAAVGNGANPFQIGSENARSRYFMYDTKEKALEFFTLYPTGYGEDFDDMLEESPSEWYLNLNGEWSFRYDKAPRNRVWPNGNLPGNSANPANTTNTGTNRIFTAGASSVFPAGQYGFDTTETYRQTNDNATSPVQVVKNGWDKLTIPSTWQVNWNPDGTFKYDRIIYRNQTLPWPNQYGNSTPTGISTSGSTTNGTLPPSPDVSNGVGTHQRDFTVPASWVGKRVFLNFDGADSFYVWVNGVPIGYSEDKMTHHEFDITEALMSRHPGIVGTHTITVQVIRWATGSHFEIQDFNRISGIFRSIYLMARNNEDLWDFQIDTRPASVAALNAGNPTDWTLNLKTAVRDFSDHLKASGTSTTVNYELHDADGNVIASGGASGTYAMMTTALNRDEYRGTFGGGVRWHADADNRTAIGTGITTARISLAKPAEFVATIPADQVRLWSADNPYLYKLVMWADNGDDTEYTAVRVGFRYVDYSKGAANTSNGRLLLNGKRVTFYGVNTHDINPMTGHTMTTGVIRHSLHLMKQTNVNAIRFSHYPHDTRWYDLCDEYGIYIMDEGNLETHYAGQASANNVTNQGLVGPLLRDRMLNMFERDKNYASVVSWSPGNESGLNANSAPYQTQVLEKREADLTQRGRGVTTVPNAPSTVSRAANAEGGRPTMSEYGREGDGLYSQLYSRMYPDIAGWWTQTGGGLPIANCEYAHAHGNASGNLDSWVYIIENKNNDVGAFLWEWVEHGIWTPIPDIDPASNPTAAQQQGVRGIQFAGQPTIDYSKRDNIIPNVTHHLAQGGNWGDTLNDGGFNHTGIHLGDYTPKPGVQELRRQYQRLKTYLNGSPTSSSVGYTVRNMEMFANADIYDAIWDITENGTVIRSGSGIHAVGPVPFGTTGNKYGSANFTARFDPITPKPNAEYFFNIRFHLRDDAMPFNDVYYNGPDFKWEERGYVVAASQLKLDAAALVNSVKPLPPLSLEAMSVTGNTAAGNTGTFTVTGPNFTYTFDKAAGKFSSMVYNGTTFITSGPEPHFHRAPIDNEYGISSRATYVNYWRNSTKAGTTTNTLNRTRGSTSVSFTDNCVVITAPFTAGTTTTYGLTGANTRTVYTIFPDGEVKVSQTYQFAAMGANYAHIGEMGSAMTVAPGFDNVQWFGRGPVENYIDRRWGSDVGMWETTVAKNYTEYNTVQTTGNHIDTRWLTLVNGSGFGIAVKAGEFAANTLFSGTPAAYHPALYNASNLIEFNALYYTQEELGSRANRDFIQHRLYGRIRKNVPGNPIQLSVNVAGRGVGGDQSWGADAHAIYRISAANKTINYNFSILPVANISSFNPSKYSREIRNLVQNVKNLMPVALAAGVAASHPAYVAAGNLAAGASDVDAASAYNALITAMGAVKPVINLAEAFGVAAVPDVNNEIRIEPPVGANLTAVVPRFETVGAGTVSISPTGAQDFSSGPVEYTLTDGAAENKYWVFIERAESARAITSFVLAGEEGVITYNAAGEGTIFVDMSAKGSINLNRIPDNIVINGSSIAPSIIEKRDFNAPVEYVVTGEDGLTRKYTVIVPGLHLWAEAGAVTLSATLLDCDLMPASANAQLILAVYDARGRLLSITSDSVSYGESAVTKALTASLPAGATAKAFLWDADAVPLIMASVL